MNCKCIPEIKEQIERELSLPGKGVADVTVPVELFTTEGEQSVKVVRASTFSELSVVFTNENKRQVIFLHSYCPFCGTKKL